MRFVIVFSIFLLTGLPCLADEHGEEKDNDEEDTLEEELSELKEDDFPDLVGTDEEGDLLDEFAFLEEAVIVETAARHKQEIGMSPSAITVITREDIETSGATTVPDLLRLVPGMDVIVTSPMFLSVTSRTYWSTEGHYYLVLVDGREANTETLGITPWTVQPFFLDDVQRIEIIRGPGSSLYGANAMAGVISITTRAVPEQTAAYAHLSAGQAGTWRAGATAATRSGNLGFSIGGGVDMANGFMHPRTSARRGWKVRSLIEYRWDQDTRLLLDAGSSSCSGPFATSVGEINSDFGTHVVRLFFESEVVRGQLFWHFNQTNNVMDSPLEFAGIHLADFTPYSSEGHTLDAEVQWNLPSFWEPLLLIAGTGGRLTWVLCDKCLNADTYTDITSGDYHQPGIVHLEGRANAFIHAELAPTDWMTITGGVRFDYNTETNEFLSPRLAAVFQPWKGHYLRLGVARAFRKPNYMEKGVHILVEFPDTSPIQGSAQEGFQEFMTRILGNDSAQNEEILSFDCGYLGQFLEGRITITLDLYVNLLRNIIELDTKVEPDEQGLPDLERSYFHFANVGDDLDVYGGELALRYSPSANWSFFASWAHRQIVIHETGKPYLENPKNLISLGMRFRTRIGLLGSLYVFTRSEFWDLSVPNPAGLMEPLIVKHLDNTALVMGRLGYEFTVSEQLRLEAGLKLFLPLSLSSGLQLRYREEGGGFTGGGESYGGELLNQVVIGYLHGSF